MFRRIAPQYRDEGLAAHPHRFVLRGQPGDMELPPLCPNCGAAATERIRLDKVFENRDPDGPTRYDPIGVELPICAACAAQHRAQVTEPTRLERVASSFATFDMVGAVMLGVAALFCGWLALKDIFKGRLISALLLLGLAGLFVLFAKAQWRKALDDTAHRRVPQPSEAARAFDFSDDLSQAFEKPRFAVSMKDAAFAQAFERLNGTRMYRAESAEAVQEMQSAKRKTVWVFAALVVLALAMAWVFGE